MKNVRIGVISYEHMHGLSYTKALVAQPGVEFVGIADDDEFRGTRMASQFGTRYFRSEAELLAQGLDGVIVCTNNARHCEATVAAAAAGCHVLVEKPFALDLVQAKRMLDAAAAAGVRVMNAFPMRFNPSVVEAKRAVAAGEIGEVLCVTGINHGKIPSGWFIDKALSGGGGVMDHTVHLADLIRWICGGEYVRVYCESGNLIHGKGIDDAGIVFAEMDGGVFATIDCSWAHHKNYPIWPQVDMEIVGTKGVLEVKAFAQVNHLVDGARGTIEDVVWNEDGDEGLVREFVDVCRTGKEPLASGLDGARALEVAQAAYRSSAAREPVAVLRVEDAR